MKKAFFVMGFGLVPLVVAIILLYLGSLQSPGSSEYWAVAPWLLLLAIPVCAAAFFIAFSTLVIYQQYQQ